MADDEKNSSAGPYHELKNLDPSEKEQAAQHAAPPAVVIHEILRKEGKDELERRTGALFWSGLAAGLSMGFSFLTLALIRSGLPDAPGGGSSGRASAILGLRHRRARASATLYKSTLTAVLPLLVRREWSGWVSLARFWAVVLSANILGTFVFARLLAIDGLFRAVARCARGGRSTVGRGSFLAESDRGGVRGLADALMICAFAERPLGASLGDRAADLCRRGRRFAASSPDRRSGVAMFVGRASFMEYVVGFLRDDPGEHGRRGRAGGAFEPRSAAPTSRTEGCLASYLWRLRHDIRPR